MIIGSPLVIHGVVHLVIICTSVSKADTLVEWQIVKTICFLVIGLHVWQVVVAASMVRHLLNIVVLLFPVSRVHSSIHLVIVVMSWREILHHWLLVLHGPRHLVPAKILHYYGVPPIILSLALDLPHLQLILALLQQVLSDVEYLVDGILGNTG